MVSVGALIFLCVYFPSNIIWVKGHINSIFNGGSYYNRYQNSFRHLMKALSLIAAMVTYLFYVVSAVYRLGCIVLTLRSPYSVHRWVDGWWGSCPSFLHSSFFPPVSSPSLSRWLTNCTRPSSPYTTPLQAQV